MTNANESNRPGGADEERARRIAEARARAEAARQARLGGGAPPPPAAEEPSTPAPPDQPPPSTVAPTVEMPAAAAAGSPADDERARRIAEARARAEAARAARTGEPAPAPETPPAAPPPPPAAAAAPAGADDRAARIAAARERALAAARARESGQAPPPAAAAQRTPEEEAARQARLEAARARAAGAAPAPAAAAPPAAPAARPAAPAAVPTARPMPAGPDDWRAPAGAAPRVVTARPEPGAVAMQQLTRQEVVNLVTRRAMMRTSFWAALAVTIAGFLLGFVNFFWPRKAAGALAVRVDKALIPQPGGAPVKITDAKAWVVNLEPGGGVPEQFTSFAQPSRNGGVLALSWKCPHLGCTVPWNPTFDFEGVKGWFRCPCHGSTYTKAGVRVFGPAPRPMDLYEVTANDDGSITINTQKKTLGSPENPQLTIQLKSR